MVPQIRYSSQKKSWCWAEWYPRALLVVLLLPELYFVLFLLCLCCRSALSYLLKSQLSLRSPLLHVVVIYLIYFLHTVCCIHCLIHHVDFCIISQIIKITLKYDPVLVTCLWCLICAFCLCYQGIFYPIMRIVGKNVGRKYTQSSCKVSYGTDNKYLFVSSLWSFSSWAYSQCEKPVKPYSVHFLLITLQMPSSWLQ